MKLRTLLLCTTILFFSTFITGKTCIAAYPDVYYGGFAYTGKYIDTDNHFKFTKMLNDSNVSNDTPLEVDIRNLFKDNLNTISGFHLIFDKAQLSNSNSETLVMALAVTREDIYTEELSDCMKVVLNLSLRVVFIEMASKTVVNSYPINLELVDVTHHPLDATYKFNLVKTAYLGSNNSVISVLSILKQDMASYKVASSNIRNFQVRKVTIEDKASQVLFSDNRSSLSDSYADLIAQKFSDELSRIAKVSVLPAGKDSLNGKCSLVFADGKEQDFNIPEASYAIDINLQDLQTKNLDANDIEKAIAFGAFLNIRIYEPEYNTEFFQKRIIQGSAKKFSNTTKGYDAREIFREVIQQAVKKAIVEMTNDRKLNREVIAKCVVS